VRAHRSIAYLTAGNLFSTLLTALGGLVIGRLVDPAMLGLFSGIALVLSYASLLQLGALSGLSRELPYFIGAGDRPRAENMCAAAQMWALALGGGVSVVLVGISMWQLSRGELMMAAGWFTNALLAAQLFYTDYLQVTYRTAADFARIAVIRVVGQTVLLVCLALVIPFDFYGLCLRALVAGAATLALLWHWRPVRVGPKLALGDLKHLFRIGLPIFLVGQVLAYWIVVDQTLVLRFGGTKMMGLFSMVIMVRTAVQTLPSAVSQVFFPRLSQKHGEGKSLTELAQDIAKPIALTAAAVLPMILALWWALGPVTRFLIPQYADAVPAMQWALLLAFVTCFEPGITVLTITRRQTLRLLSILAGMAAYAGCLVWLIRDEVRLVAFPQAMLAGRAVYLLLGYAIIYRLVAKERGEAMK
jgi:O-antigen/teichoic acid export membrane protein